MPMGNALSIEWSLGLAGGLCILLPAALAIAWHRRTGAPYLPFVYGALIFIVFQIALRLPWQVPLALWVREHKDYQAVFLAFSGLTAGLFEEVGRYVGFRLLLRDDRSVPTAVMYGLGHGGIESALLVGLNLVGFAVALVLVSQGLISNPQLVAKLQAAASTVSPSSVVFAVVERVGAMVLHVGLTLIVLQAVARREIRWLALAIAVHALVDYSAVVLAKQLMASTLVVEAVAITLASATLFAGVKLSRPVQLAPAS